jgi:nitronate monooxygenase
MFTDAFSGRSARAMRSRFAEDMGRTREPLPDFRQMFALSEPIRQAASDEEASFLLYGQSAALNREMPAADLVAVLCEETNERLSRLAAR